MIKIKSLKGVNDILPFEIGKWNHVEQQARQLFSLYEYKEIRIPIIEESALFSKSIGQETDIVEKEMYTFLDKGKRSIALRPEATASVVRAYLEHNFDQQGLVKLFYLGPMFRGEKPQSGRNRQFYQIGVEALGSYHAYLDAEVISLANAYLNMLGLKNFKIILNSVGCFSDKLKFSNLLKEYLQDKSASLCLSCQQRMQRNVLRILDCKDPTCRKIMQNAPQITKNLCNECEQHFAQVKEALTSLKLAYETNPYLVRGLDYYTKTVFEIIHFDLGAQNAISAGGRYDNLVEDLGGQPTGAIGFAFGIDRLLLACDKEKLTSIGQDKKTDVFIISLGQTASQKAFEITHDLRGKQISTYLNFEQKSLKSQMRQADKLQYRFVLILGDDELAKCSILLKDMATSNQELIKFEELVNVLKKRLINKA